MKSPRKTIAILDMWASSGTALGPSKHWLYNQLSTEFDVQVVSPPQKSLRNLFMLIRSISYTKHRWGSRYYQLKEGSGKTPQAFIRRTRLFQKALNNLACRPDLVLQIGGLFGPVDTGGVPYLSYHDQTVAMVEASCPDWLPANFTRTKDDWYGLERTFYNSVTKVVTYSSVTKRSMVNDYDVDEDNVIVIPTACKLPFPSSEQISQPRKKQLLFVSTEFNRKGGDILLEAFPLIKSAIPDIQLVIAGGKLPPEVIIDDPSISYVGPLSSQELQQQYLNSILLVHPARYDAFPNVLKEAIACGLPVVASASCGIPEILDYGNAGVILPELTSNDLATEVINLLNDKARYQQMQQHCLEIREKYQPAAIGNKFINLINSCLGGQYVD